MTKIISGVASRFASVRLGALIFSVGVLGAIVFPLRTVCAAPALSSVIDVSPFSPNGMVVAPNGETLYVAATAVPVAAPAKRSVLSPQPLGVSELLVINTQFKTITAIVDLFNLNVTGLNEFGALQVAINKQNTLIFVGNFTSGTVDVIDQATNTEIATFEHNVIGPAPIGIAVSPNGKELWVANSATPPAFNNGTVQVIDVDLSSPTFGKALTLINTGASPNEIVFNSKGSAAYVLNGGLTGFVDEIRVKTFDILRNNIANSELDSPNPLAMDITEDNSTLYIGNGTSYVNNVDIPAGTIDNYIYMFPAISPGVQDIGQVLISPDQKWVVSADVDIGALSVVHQKTQAFDGFIELPVGSHPYFMAFRKTTLYVSDYNQMSVGTSGGNTSISVITGF
jgi:YVTN family beta-propeller protein